MRCILLISSFILLTSNSFHAQENNDFILEYVNQINARYNNQNDEALKAFERLYDSIRDEENLPWGGMNELFYSLNFNSFMTGNHSKVKLFSKDALSYISEHKIPNAKAPFFNFLGMTYLRQNMPDSSAYYFVKSVDEFEESGKLENAALVNFNISNIYFDLHDYSNALKYLKKCEYYFEKNNKDSGVLYLVKSRMSYCYLRLDNLVKAREYSNKALSKKDSNLKMEAFMYGSITRAELLMKEMKYDSAYHYAVQSFKISKDLKKEHSIGETSKFLLELLVEKNPQEAILYGKEALDIFSNDERFFVEIVKNISEAYLNNKDYGNAAIYQKKYIKYQDSILKSDYNKNTIDILEKYEAAQKELKINEQQSEIDKKNNQNRLFAIISLSLLVVALLLTFLFVQKRRAQKEKIRNLENEKENIALKSLMAGEEKERSRIAKELHDGIGSLLAASKMHASALLTKDPEASETLISLLDNASNEARRISHNLLPESLINKGLDVALQDFVETINEGKLLQVEYQSINFKHNLPQSTQLTIYRIVQELLNNIIKHSGATEAFVQLNQNDKKLIITVEDNGRGFSSGTDFKGIGLQNIESRLSLLNGKIEVDSKETMGTSVYIEFEIEK